MVSWRWLIASGFIALLSSGCTKQPTSGEIAKQVGNSVVLITYADTEGSGSGFFVSGENKVCTVLTARHVVAPSSKLKLQTNDRKFWNSATIQNFPNQDLALITFDPGSENCPYKALELGDSDTVNVGDGIYITGFPGGSSAPQFVPGTVSALGKLSDGYGISYPVITTRGMSGGPVVNTAGKIIAIHGRSERELVEKAERTGENLPPQQQSAQSVNSADGDAQNTFKWGIPSNTYKVNLSKILAEAAATTKAEELLNSGNDLLVSERYKEAVIDYDKAIEIKPDYHEAWNNRGYGLRKLEQYQEAIASYDKAIQIKPDKHEAWAGRGYTLDELQQYREAIASYDKAIQFKPDFHEAWYNRGLALRKLEQYQEAIASYDKAIQIKPDKHEAWYGRGYTLDELQQYREAIASYDKAIQFKPDFHEAWAGRGYALGELQQYQEAIASYDKAIQFKPDFHEVWASRGYALGELQQYEKAIASYDKAIQFKPDKHEAWAGRGYALGELQQYEKAIASYDKAIQFKPDYQLAIDNRKKLLTQLGRSK
ncbi:tetratricopeptide repeat-containing serine protease family protein [Coleofasciculus sp. FACHB-1120]|uniref:tetratricopeptide repeat-containing S1 family peptidase n=1 Tax=Coleofasciculus sp. FACHB-1120 TaxID=2692783 RepID=UPI001F553DF9|nr:tetratricopeptide repeat-containing serine protease family protein [Coleofasciculus sp. FACHB-1120]